MPKTEPPAIGEETVQPGEARLVTDFTAFLKKSSTARYRAGAMRRFNQARAAGCVEAEFSVLDLAPDHRVGFFATPRTYPARIRFANASSASDSEQDIRGMAIQVAGSDGDNLTPGSTTQDFVLNSHPVMVAGTAGDFLELLKANEAGGRARRRYFLFHPKSAAIALAAQQHHLCHLDIPYWSATPYRYGPSRAVKYYVRPTSPRRSEKPSSWTETYLTDALRDHLRQSEASFDFFVQFQTDAKRQPIEDASVEWREKDAPYLLAARITIPIQRIEGGDRVAACERARFNPWHCLAEHRPLGSMNRVRGEIYRAMAAFRAEMTASRA